MDKIVDNVAAELLFALKNLLAVHRGEGGTAFPADAIAQEAINRAEGRPYKVIKPVYYSDLRAT